MGQWDKPKPITDMELAFPADVVGNYLPMAADIPKEFSKWGNPWTSLFSKWFAQGLKGQFKPKPGIDLVVALRHIKACMGSFQPNHEHKEVGVAYLMSLWFEKFISEAEETAQP